MQARDRRRLQSKVKVQMQIRTNKPKDTGKTNARVRHWK